MDGFPVRQQNDPQIPPVHLRNGCPTANPAILLNDFFLRVVNDVLDPFLLDDGTIRTVTHGMEVLGEFHRQQSTRRDKFAKSRRLDLLKDIFFSPSKTDDAGRSVRSPRASPHISTLRGAARHPTWRLAVL